MTTDIKRTSNDCRIEKLTNGFVVTKELRNNDGDWYDERIYCSTVKDAMEEVQAYFFLPKD
jgi:hypothetical protein